MRHHPLVIRRWAVRLLAGLSCLGAWPAGAQPSAANIEAQEIRRQQERDRQQRERLERTPDVRLPRAEPAAPAAVPTGPDLPCRPIRSVTLRGDAAERFAFALDAVPGRADWAESPACLGARGIDAVLQQVQNAVLVRGYVTTRVLAEPQNLNAGELRLTVIPGRVRSVRLDDGGTQRATAVNALPVRAGEVLDLRDIEQGLENFKRLPSADADIQIAPGDQPGESDLIIQWRQSNPWRLNLSLDDAGSRSTGRYQGSLTISYDHWWTLNDLFYVTANRALGGGGQPRPKGSDGLTAHYSVPWGPWLLAWTAGANDYRQSVAGFSQSYVYSGDSRTAELRLSRVVHRDALGKTSAFVAGWTRSSYNAIDDTEIEVQRRRMAGWEAGLSTRRAVGPAFLDADVSYRRGTGAFGSLRAPEEPFGEGTSRPEIVRASAQLNLPWQVDGHRLRYGLGWRAQWNRSPLVPQDRYAIGNRYTVRGFDGEQTLSAERGWLVRQELGLALGASGAELYGGIDHGEVGGPSVAALRGRRLTGGVLGLRASHGRAFGEVFVSQPVSEPEDFRTASTHAGFQLYWSY